MAKLTMVFGVLLVVMSFGFWLAMGRTEMAAFHPAGVGVLLSVCGTLANTENVKRRMLWMHIAVLAGLFGLVITSIRVFLPMVKKTASMGSALAFDERIVTASICLVFVALCVRSFIAARRLRAE